MEPNAVFGVHQVTGGILTWAEHNVLWCTVLAVESKVQKFIADIVTKA